MTQINDELLEYFLLFLRRKPERSMKTIRNVERDIKNFLSFIQNHYQGEINSKALRAYIDFLNTKYLETSVLSKFSSIRQFIRWLNLDPNPLKELVLEHQVHDLEAYSQEELLFQKTGEPFSYDELIIRTIYDLYLTLEELCSLKISDYNQASGSLAIRNSYITVSGRLKELLRSFLKYERNKINQEEILTLDSTIFINDSGKLLTTNNIIELLKKHNL